MGGVARLAKELGHSVSGSDANTYPPMSTQLESLGVGLHEGYCPSNIPDDADIIIIGNTIGRGNPELEHVLDRNLPYTSGAQWLGENLLRDRWVLAVSGTHGKTTTSSLLAWILEANGLEPGYLIGGVPENFGESARLGNSQFFVIEADEYDTAFSDKRSKFLHYHPRTLIINNLEFDHADIFRDMRAIEDQFHHLLKIVPSHGLVIANGLESSIKSVITRGCWSELSHFLGEACDWDVTETCDDYSKFIIHNKGQQTPCKWNLIGKHNMHNALAAVAAAHHIGVTVKDAVGALAEFRSVKRRMELIYSGTHKGHEVKVFDDFAHHPTAIAKTLDGLRKQVPEENIIAVLEPRSNTMKQGVHKHLLNEALGLADTSLIYASAQVEWDINMLEADNVQTSRDVNTLIDILISQIEQSNRRSNVLIMSNGGFEGLYQRLLNRLS